MSPKIDIADNFQAATFLRWAGSKRQLVPILKEYYRPDVKRYLEPFAGSACLFFALRPKKAILGDINSDLIATYVELKYRSEKLTRAIARMHRSKRRFLHLRELDPATLSRTARAARFIYLNRFCFNGLYRTNSGGKFNVPYGGEGSGQLPSKALLIGCSRLLKRARLVNGDFARVLMLAKSGDFVYMDPPFALSGRRVFNEYHPATFLESDINRLRRWMEVLDKRGARFVVSYADCPEASQLRRGFDTRIVTVRRNIAGFTEQRARSKELLISNI